MCEEGAESQQAYLGPHTATASMRRTHPCHQANLLYLNLPSTTQQDDEMAPGQKMYPRATVKKIVKAHSNCKVSKNADVTVSLASKAPPTRFQQAGPR